MKREKSPSIPMKDAQLDELVQELRQRLETHQSVADAPELRMVHDIRSAYQTETSEDAHSLERVLMRLQEDQSETQSNVLFPHMYKQKERLFALQNNIEISSNIKKSRRWQIPVGVLAAALLLTLIIGGLLIGLRAGQATPIAHGTSSAPGFAPDALFASFGLPSSANQANKVSFNLNSFCKDPQKDWSGSGVDAKDLKWLRANSAAICRILAAVGKAEKTRFGIEVIKIYDGDLLVEAMTHDYRTGKDTYSRGSVHAGAHFTLKCYMNGQFLGAVV